ncbi:hypothetical protein D3C85_526510 [compost metagenome]
MKNVFWTDGVGDIPNDFVVPGSQVSERGDQGARANARDDLEHGASPMRGPPRNESCCECACVTASRNCQHICQRQDVVRFPCLGESLALAFVALSCILNEQSQVVVQPIASIGNARDDRFFR